MYNPPHPGEVLKDTVLARVTITEFAEQLGVSRVTMSNIVNGRSSITAEMALRLADALGGSPESWLRMQGAFDLWQAKKKHHRVVLPKKFALKLAA
jgi:addiction module HigA family antidote